MRQKELFPVQIDQELIDTFYSHRTEVKKINKRIFFSEMKLNEYRKIIEETPSFKQNDGCINFLFYKKVSLCKSIIETYLQEIDILSWYLFTKVEWMQNFKSYIENIENIAQQKNYLHSLK